MCDAQRVETPPSAMVPPRSARTAGTPGSRSAPRKNRRTRRPGLEPGRAPHTKVLVCHVCYNTEL